MKKTLCSSLLLTVMASACYADTPDVSKPVPLAPNAPAAATPATSASSNTVIDCNYRLPADQASIDTALVSAWAEKAAIQAFTLSPAALDNQMNSLKACFTEGGWKGFTEALTKSGNIDSIKTQQLNVSSQTDGSSSITTIKDNQWKVTLPIQVVYQNDKEKVTQRLNVDVVVGRKPSGDLGIEQIIASAKATDKTSAPPQQPETPKPEAAAPATSDDASKPDQSMQTPPTDSTKQKPIPTSQPAE